MQNYQQHKQQCQLEQQRTSYQGRKRCFGEFKCPVCHKTWKSANSRSNEPQLCTNCRIQVFPQKQKSLESLFDGLRREKHIRAALIETATRQPTPQALNHHQSFNFQVTPTTATTFQGVFTAPSSFSHIWTN